MLFLVVNIKSEKIDTKKEHKSKIQSNIDLQ